MYQGLALSTSMFELRKESMMAAANSPWHAYDALYKEVAALHLRPRLHGTAAADRPLPDRETLPRHLPGAEGGSTAGFERFGFPAVGTRGSSSVGSPYQDFNKYHRAKLHTIPVNTWSPSHPGKHFVQLGMMLDKQEWPDEFQF